MPSSYYILDSVLTHSTVMWSTTIIPIFHIQEERPREVRIYVAIKWQSKDQSTDRVAPNWYIIYADRTQAVPSGQMGSVYKSCKLIGFFFEKNLLQVPNNVKIMVDKSFTQVKI